MLLDENRPEACLVAAGNQPLRAVQSALVEAQRRHCSQANELCRLSPPVANRSSLHRLTRTPIALSCVDRAPRRLADGPKSLGALRRQSLQRRYFLRNVVAKRKQ